jgi:hypothetical protein
MNAGMTRFLCGSLALFLVLGAAAGCGKSKKKKRAEASTEGLTGGVLVFSDDFERPELGADWLARSGRWKIRDGRLNISNDKNEGAWLNQPLPERVRVEFDAVANTDEGDLKFEIFATEQRHQTGYIVILGGWRNTVSIIARLNEHGEDRLEADAKAVKGRVHHLTAVRTDNSLRWYVDGNLVLKFDDEEPIRGTYFAFNDWAADVSFDNLRIYKL